MQMILFSTFSLWKYLILDIFFYMISGIGGTVCLTRNYKNDFFQNIFHPLDIGMVLWMRFFTRQIFGISSFLWNPMIEFTSNLLEIFCQSCLNWLACEHAAQDVFCLLGT